MTRKNVYIFPGTPDGVTNNTGPGWNVGATAQQSIIDGVIENYKNQTGFENPPENLTAPGSFTYDPVFTSFVNGLGCAMIDYVSLKIGNKELERITGEWIMLNNELTNQGNSKKMFYNSVYYQENFTLAEDNVKNIDLIIPITLLFHKR